MIRVLIIYMVVATVMVALVRFLAALDLEVSLDLQLRV